MAQETPSGNPPNPQEFQEQFTETARKQLEALAQAQKQFWDVAGQISQVWLDQAQSEAALMSELFGRLASARSASDAAAIYQEFANRQLQIITDGNRRLFKDSEDLLKANTRLFSARSGGFSS